QAPRAGADLDQLAGPGADRTAVGHAARRLRGQRLAVIGADLQALATVHATQLVRAGDLAGETHAAGAMDAAGHLGRHQRTDVFVRHHALALDEAADRAAVTQRQVLQLALAALVADRAVQRMVDQQELEHVALRVEGLLVTGEDLHAVHDRRGTGRRRLRRRAPAHFGVHQAHAAVGGDRQLVVVAEARNRDAGLVRGLDDHRSLGRGQFHPVDEDGDVVRRNVRVDGLRTHAATSRLERTTVPSRSSSTRKRLFTIAYSNSCR